MFANQKRKNAALKTAVVLVWAVSVAGMGLMGCQANHDVKPFDSNPAAPKVLGIFPAPPEQSGAQLWANTCNRCHNAPPPERFSDAQWAVIVHHMRLRANLTGEETRKITEFLQASN